MLHTSYLEHEAMKPGWSVWKKVERGGERV
jgi:hypothetical protein